MRPGAGFAAALFLLLAACGAPAAGPAPPPANRPAVPHPELAGVEAAAREQLEAQRRRLEELRADPGVRPGPLADAYGEIGRLYHVYGLPGPAEAAYQAAVRLAPGEPRWPYLAGLLAQEQGRFEAALACFDQALELAPGDGPSLLRSGEVLLELARPEEARERFAAAQETGEGCGPAARFGLGRAAAAQGDAVLAVEHFRAVVAARPEAGKVRYPLALALRSLGRVEEARAELSLSQAGEVGFPDPHGEGLRGLAAGAGVHMREGGEALMAGRLGEAEAAYRRAVAAAPDYGDARRNLAQALSRQGRHREAAAELEAGLEGRPDDVWLHFDLANSLLAEGDAEGAARHFRRAVELAPDLSSARFNLANALIRLGRWQEAREQLERVIAAEPGNANALYLAAMARFQLGDSGAAEDRLRALVAEHPEHGPARQGLAQVLGSRGRWAEAAELLAGVSPRTPEVAVSEAVAWSRAGRSEEALASLEEALAADPGEASLTLTLARLLATSPDPAVRDGRRALALARALYEAQPSLPQAQTLGLALAAAGDYAAAAQWQRSLLARVEQAGQGEAARLLRADLAFFEQGRPALRPLQ